MSEVYAHRSHRRSYARGRSIHGSFPLAPLAIVLIFLTLAAAWWLNYGPAKNYFAGGSYNVMGQPTIKANLINQVLAYYNSPAQGKGQALYNLGVKYGVDPVYALAFFMHESSFGTTGVARTTRSLGNIRATAGYRDFEGYRFYSTWEAGFEDWYRLITNLYVGQWNLTTVDQIIPVYAPSSDNNDVDAYIQAVKTAVDTWRGGTIAV
jgi:hypothetical protein